MMCGGHGFHHILDLVVSDTPQTHDSPYYSDDRRETISNMEQQVKLMYAHGEIGAEAFHRLLEVARAGGLKSGDLMAFQSHHVDTAPAGHRQGANREAAASHLEQLQQERSQLEAACAETEESLRHLRLEAAHLVEDAESAGIASKGAAPGSEDSQALSRSREEALARARLVDERIGHIEERLAHLRSQLREAIVREQTAYSGA